MPAHSLRMGTAAALLLTLTGCVGGLRTAPPIAPSDPPPMTEARSGRDISQDRALMPLVDSPTDYRKQRLAEALRGIRFADGRVERVDADAAARLAALDADVTATSELARARDLLERNLAVEAISAATSAVLLAPQSADAYETLGAALLLKRKEPEALAAFSTALELAPDRPNLHAQRAATLQRLARLDEAAAEYEQVVALAPDNAAAHTRLAILRYYLEDDAAAWKHVAAAEALGGRIPPQFLTLLAARTPRPE